MTSQPAWPVMSTSRHTMGDSWPGWCVDDDDAAPEPLHLSVHRGIACSWRSRSCAQACSCLRNCWRWRGQLVSSCSRYWRCPGRWSHPSSRRSPERRRRARRPRRRRAAPHPSAPAVRCPSARLHARAAGQPSIGAPARARAGRAVPSTPCRHPQSCGQSARRRPLDVYCVGGPAGSRNCGHRNAPRTARWAGGARALRSPSTRNARHGHVHAEFLGVDRLGRRARAPSIFFGVSVPGAVGHTNRDAGRPGSIAGPARAPAASLDEVQARRHLGHLGHRHRRHHEHRLAPALVDPVHGQTAFGRHPCL
jgi:hypothetical protein